MVLATTNIETPLIMTFLWEFHIKKAVKWKSGK